MRLVILESPFRGKTPEETTRNECYARACLADALKRGEAPFASHLLYTQPGVLDDRIPEERRQGTAAGLAWSRVADATVIYGDLGITEGMLEGVAHAAREGRLVVPVRFLGAPWANGSGAA